MTNFNRKLRSKAGASMLIALVFLLFCTFIGGSVLVSATANANRVANMANQQQHLNQRSAGLLLVDELKSASGNSLKMVVRDEITKTDRIFIHPNGGYDAPYASETVQKITISIPSGTICTPMQRMLFESAVLRYLVLSKQAGISINPADVVFQNVKYQTSGMSVPVFIQSILGTVPANEEEATCFWMPYDATAAEVSGKLSVAGTSGSNPMPGFDAEFTCSGNPMFTYDFDVDFDVAVVPGATERLSQMRVHVNADEPDINAPAPIPGFPEADTAPTQTPPAGDKAGKIVSRSFKDTVISWNQPEVVKGGADK